MRRLRQAFINDTVKSIGDHIGAMDARPEVKVALGERQLYVTVLPNELIQRLETKLAHFTPCETKPVQPIRFLTAVDAYRAEERSNEACLHPWALVDNKGLELRKIYFLRGGVHLHHPSKGPLRITQRGHRALPQLAGLVPAHDSSRLMRSSVSLDAWWRQYPRLQAGQSLPIPSPLLSKVSTCKQACIGRARPQRVAVRALRCSRRCRRWRRGDAVRSL